jgi:4-hydroxybenzoate polyprenyltransferase
MKVADYLKIFDEVIASDPHANMRGEESLRALHSLIGGQRFFYIGSDQRDLPLWKSSTKAMVTNASRQVEERLRQSHHDVVVLEPPKGRFADYFRALRPHQWAKNLLVFVPLVTSHRVAEPETVISSGLAFLAFCFMASTIYVLNDLADLDGDRSHSSKRTRAIASGKVRAGHAIGLGIFCALTAVACAIALPFQFGLCLAGYALLASAYTFFLKQKLILDAICLSGLYTGRILGGSAAIAVVTSTWLLTFAMMMFFSLALAKRCAELDTLRKQGGSSEGIKGRCYRVGDMPQLANLGTASGLVSVLVIALYINSPAVVVLYATPELLLLVCPLVFSWIARIWTLVNRGQMHEDPIVFALHDRTSWVVLLSVLLLVFLATNFSLTGN